MHLKSEGRSEAELTGGRRFARSQGSVRLRPQQGYVAEQDQYLVIIRRVRHRLLHRVTRAELICL